ncbi:MAG TPA: ribulose-phosphate 3-epimerase [Oligoflexia bacterium]|nr:ribulose-phosphate 3-epimerase [Oligoflexia bacterium]HMP27903.1 ribulose-phosphate 3-epimerase [Oligoflexia bacterium]
MVNQNQIKIAPSILAADFGKLKEEILSVERDGADLLHIDIMDGQFVPEITFGANMVKLAKSLVSLPLDTHLMTISPWKHFDLMKSAGADRLYIHYEVCLEKSKTYLDEIKSLNIQNGLVINPKTESEAIYPFLPFCDSLLVMSVNPGWSGQQFLSETLKKVRKIAKEIEKTKSNCELVVDGGLNQENCKEVISAGAKTLVFGAAFFKTLDKKSLIKVIKEF